MAINVEYPFMFGNRASIFDGLIPWEVGQELQFANGIWHYTDPCRHYTGPKVAGNAGGWLVTEVDGGTDAAQGVSLLDGSPGVLQIATNDADNDTCTLQKLGEHYQYVAGKMSYFMARIATTDANDGELHFGMNIADTSPIASVPTDGMFFHKAETATSISFSVIKNNTNQETIVVDATAITDNEFRIYGWYVLPNGNIYVFTGTTLETCRVVGIIAAGDPGIPDDEALAFHFAVMTGSTDVTALLVNGFSAGRGL
jgi:hypothetical protein